MEFSNDYENTLDRDRKGFQLEQSHLGISTHPGRHQLAELRSTISKGVKHIELGWFGQGKGSIGQGNLNPEVHSSEEREDMRQLAKINKVTLSTHASPNIGALSGLSEGGFSKDKQEAAKHEVDRAISFAADVAEGGPVVVHVGEFQRPIFEAEKRFGSTDEFFESTDKEKEKAPIFLVDKESGRIKQLPRNAEIFTETSQIDPATGLPKLEKKSVYQLLEEKKSQGVDKPEVEIYKELVKKELDLARGEAHRALAESKEKERRATNFRKIATDLQSSDPETKERARNFVVENLGIAPERAIAELRAQADASETEAKYFKQIVSAKNKELIQTQDNLDKTETIYDYGKREAAEAIADEAVKAYRIEKERNLKNPLFMAVENWDPNLYGSHPKELRELIYESRDKMKERLKVEQKMSDSQAAKVAEEHIKATFDIGHANFWRKYFKRVEGETGEQHETRFKSWLMDNVRELTKDGIIGHVHLSDNFGWHDEHLTPGLGNAPIEEFVKEVSQGKDWKGKMIIEPGGQPEGLAHTAMTGTWRQLNTPIYRIDASPTSWTEIENSYFANVGPATSHVVGEYVPFKDWSSWSSEIPLE